MVVHHRRYLRRSIVNQWSHEQRGSTKFLFPSYICPLPTLPSDHSSASCTRADVRICPAIHRLGQRMVKLKNLWRNLCPTAKIYRRFIRQDKNYLSSLAEFSNARWIHCFRIAQFMRLYLDATTFDSLYLSFKSRVINNVVLISSLFREASNFNERKRYHIDSYVREREKCFTNWPMLYRRHQISLIFVHRREGKKNQGVRAKWKKRNRIIIHLVMFGQSFRPQQPS